jgi:N-dimethylarginine dimethylaminohydrolase
LALNILLTHGWIPPTLLRRKKNEQWQNLVSTLKKLGAEVELLEPVEGLPDLFYSKTPGKLLEEKSTEEAFNSIKGYGQEYIDRFNEWKELFSVYS